MLKFSLLITFVILIAILVVVARKKKEKKEAFHIMKCVVAFFEKKGLSRDECLEFAELFVDVVVLLPEDQLQHLNEIVSWNLSEYEMGRLILNHVIYHYDGFSRFYISQTLQRQMLIKRIKAFLLD